MAEGYIKSKNLPEVYVSSAGFCADNMPVTENAAAVMKNAGINIENHKSTLIHKDMLISADLIICMAKEHKDVIESAFGEQKSIAVLNIEDPIGGDILTYTSCRNGIFAAVDALLADFSVTDFSVEDASAVAAVESECFSQPWSKAAVLDAAKHGHKFFTAKSHGIFLGYVGVKFIGGEGYIDNLAVTAAARGKGVGTALLTALNKYATNAGADFLTLEVRASNKNAISLYSAFGFKTEGTRKGFYTNPAEDALILTKRYV